MFLNLIAVIWQNIWCESVEFWSGISSIWQRIKTHYWKWTTSDKVLVRSDTIKCTRVGQTIIPISLHRRTELQNVQCFFSLRRTMLRMGRTMFVSDRYFKVSLWRRANARNVRLYYPYRQYTNLSTFRIVSEHCLRITLHLFQYFDILIKGECQGHTLRAIDARFIDRLLVEVCFLIRRYLGNPFIKFIT